MEEPCQELDKGAPSSLKHRPTAFVLSSLPSIYLTPRQIKFFGGATNTAKPIVTVFITTTHNATTTVDKRQFTKLGRAIPDYASACSDASAYSSACSCLGITNGTITVTGAPVCFTSLSYSQADSTSTTPRPPQPQRIPPQSQTPRSQSPHPQHQHARRTSSPTP